MGTITQFGQAGRWRLLRHDAGQAASIGPVAYVLLYSVCLMVAVWSQKTFGTTVLWTANAVLLAAILQLKGNRALAVLAICVTINLVFNAYRGDEPIFLICNASLNLIQVLVAVVLTRRMCGSALDMRRPRRLFRYVFLAVVPAVALTSMLSGVLAIMTVPMSTPLLLFRVQHLFDMELLAMVIVTPSLLLLSQQHRFKHEKQPPQSEVVALMGLVVITTLWVFTQSSAPLLFMIFPPIIFLAFRLTPRWTVLAVLFVVLVGGFMTLHGLGPVSMTIVKPDPALDMLPAVLRRINVLHLFLLALMGTALPITTLSKERSLLMKRLEKRTLVAIEARQKAEKAEQAKSRFLALMSHELRTPLTAVTGYADLLSRNPTLDGEGRRQVDAMIQGSEAMIRLVDDILEITRGGEEVTLKPHDLRAVIEEGMHPSTQWADVRNLAYTLDIAPDAEGLVLTDARRLRQILHHLGLNAVKFTHKGEIRLMVTRVGDRLRFAITDTGCGMTAEIRAGIFRLFEQADASTSRAHEGAGVGLALVQVHTRCLGGTISVESYERRGTTFTLEIPAPAVSETPAEPQDTLESGRMRILIVDDNVANRDLLRIMMEAVDCDTDEAEDGVKAIQAVRHQRYDMVLMDVRMPNMDGIAATTRIRNLPEDCAIVPILAVTADAMPEDIQRCLSAGMDGHLAKPITQARLYDAVNAAFEAASVRMGASDKVAENTA